MQVKLDECPPGLFEYGGELCFKSEYMTKTTDGRYKCDCYIVSTGEYFAGGVSEDERGSLMVEPVWAQVLHPRTELEE